jgi:hypothetical protein
VRFPVEVSFRVLALAAKVSVYDAAGALQYFMRQKAFKLREDVTVYADEAETTPVARVRADRVIDFSAQYHITDAAGAPLGLVRRRGRASLWRATYEIVREGAVLYTLREANPWVKVADGLFQQIPLVGMLSGYVFHPRYVLWRGSAGAEGAAAEGDGAAALRIRKEAALLESTYVLSDPAGLPPADEPLVLFATLMALVLERSRG